MRRFDKNSYKTLEIVDELLHGAGAVVFPGLFDKDTVDLARQEILDRSNVEPPRVTHFQGKAEEDKRLDRQRRVWNLLSKGKVFTQIAENPVLIDVMRSFLGTEFIMGSIAANRILPGGPGQEPHIDYPYWDFYKRDSFPVHLNSSFPMNAQATIILDPFTAKYRRHRLRSRVTARDSLSDGRRSLLRKMRAHARRARRYRRLLRRRLALRHAQHVEPGS